jgi:hypothetical protein
MVYGRPAKEPAEPPKSFDIKHDAARGSLNPAALIASRIPIMFISI